MGKNVCIPHLGMSGISGSAHGMVFKLTSRNSLARDGKQMMPPIYSYGWYVSVRRSTVLASVTKNEKWGYPSVKGATLW